MSGGVSKNEEGLFFVLAPPLASFWSVLSFFLVLELQAASSKDPPQPAEKNCKAKVLTEAPKHNLDLSRHFVGEKFVDHCKQVSDINRFISVYPDRRTLSNHGDGNDEKEAGCGWR